jgi:L-threonate 2-dehydrogenase
MTTIAVIAMGEMGAGVARRLVERGARVLTSLAGRSAASAERARDAGVEAVSDAELVEAAELFLSIAPPANAPELAERFRPLIARSSGKLLYVDCNAIAPRTLRSMARRFEESNLRFLDGSIIGPPPKADGSSPRIYISGPASAEAERLRDFGLDIRVLSGQLGDASAIKMSYAGITKGFQALGTAMVLGAFRNGAGESFPAELKSSQPQLHAWLTRELPRMYPKAYRWVGEMEEIAKFLEPELGASEMLIGAAHLYEHVAVDNRAGPHSEILSILNSFAKKDL